MLGLGGTVDFELTLDEHVLGELVREYDIVAGELSRSRAVESARDAIVVLLAHIDEAVGSERFLADPAVAHELAAKFEHRVTLGGTCTRAALAMHVLGVPSTLHLVSIDDTVRRLLPPGIEWVCSAQSDSLDPHLIIQFAKGFTVEVGDRTITARRADRVIFANDPPHRELRIADELGELSAEADVIVLSSFNVIQDEHVLRDRLATVLRHVQRRPADSILFFEDAAYHRAGFSRVVRDALVERVDVWSMNESEAAEYLGYPLPVDEPSEVADALRSLHAAVPARTLVLHTAGWAAAIGREPSRWRDALVLGTSVAGCRFGRGDSMTAADVVEVLDGPRQKVGLDVAAALNTQHDIVCVAAPAITTPSPTTIGLGDAFVGGMVAALSVGLPAVRSQIETR